MQWKEKIKLVIWNYTQVSWSKEKCWEIYCVLEGGEKKKKKFSERDLHV